MRKSRLVSSASKSLGAVLDRVICSSITSCIAAGYYDSNDAQEGARGNRLRYVLDVAQAPPPRNAGTLPDASLGSVTYPSSSCPAVSSCDSRGLLVTGLG